MKRLLILLTTLLLIQGMLQTVFAIPNEGQMKSKNFKFTSDMDLRGVYGSDSFYFYVDEFWNIRTAGFSMFMTQSQLLDEKYSTLTVLLNGKPVYSMDLGGRKEYKENVEIVLPVREINAKYNELRIQLYRRISDKACTDDLNTANWLTVHKDSFVHLGFDERPSTRNLGEFPYPFMKSGEEPPMGVIIAVPDDFTDKEASSAATLSAGLGSMQKFENLSVGLYRISDAPRDFDMIFIGRTASTPPEILSLYRNEERKTSNNYAVLKRAASPYNSTKEILAIISNNEEALMSAVRLLSNSQLIKQVKGDTLTLSRVDLKSIDTTPDGDVTFEELGYSNVNLEGPFRQQSSFTVSIPKNRVIREGSRMILNFRNSKNLDFSRSLVSIYINDIPVGSKKLTEAGADNNMLEVQLPEDVRKSNTYNIRVAFDLEVENLDCIIRRENNPWAYILNTSHLSLIYNDGNQILFENYSNPFVKDGILNRAAAVIPDNSGTAELKVVSNLAAFIGHDITLNTNNIEIIRSGNFNKDSQDKNLIVIGTPSNNSLIKEINKALYIKYSEDFTGFSSNEKVNLLEDYSKRLTALEFVKSPYNKESSVLIITSPEMKYIYNAQRYLTDFEFKGRLEGNAALIDEDGSVQNFNFTEEGKKQENKIIPKKITLNEQTSLFIAFLGFLVLFIIILTVLLLRKRRRNK